MKHGSFRAICLIFMMACIAVVSASSDENTVRLITKVLETFDGDNRHYDWMVDGSKFTFKPDVDDQSTWYPLRAWTDNQVSYPKAAYKDPVESLGVWGKFTRRGYNWIDIYPAEKHSDADANGDAVADLVDRGQTKDGNPMPPGGIPIIGRIQYLDMWVWGSNLKYSLEAYFRDYRGVMHVISMGSLNYTGWKNLRARVPDSVPQAKTVLPRLAPLEFVKFRIWTEPTEQVDNFYIYFNRFNILFDNFETPYDGDPLTVKETVEGNAWEAGK